MFALSGRDGDSDSPMLPVLCGKAAAAASSHSSCKSAVCISCKKLAVTYKEGSNLSLKFYHVFVMCLRAAIVMLKYYAVISQLTAESVVTVSRELGCVITDLARMLPSCIINPHRLKCRTLKQSGM